MAVVVFLRGMNLGNRRITNDDLAASFAGLGFDGAIPYQASGNVILAGVDELDGDRLAAGLEDDLGYEVPVFVRTGQQVIAIASESPFSGQRGVDGGKPQIVFRNDARDVDLSAVFGPDHRHELIGAAVHWLPPGGLAELGGMMQDLDRALGGTTVRTLGTIERIAKKIV